MAFIFIFLFAGVNVHTVILQVLTGSEDIMERYIDTVALEFRHRNFGSFEGNPLTIYVGGGTPSLVPAFFIKKIMSVTDIVQVFSPQNNVEFTVEANPESICHTDPVNERWLDGILEAGANRISIGLQALNDSILRNLGRLHNTKQAVLSVTHARQSGFTNISIDLMFGVPGQTIEIWKQTLEEALELQPNHVSGYSLSIEEDTEYYDMMRHNRGLKIPENEETVDMYILMNEMFEKEGLHRYEISNFARAGYECKHNQSYWNFTPYLGIGSSAHSFDGKIRLWNEPYPAKYMECYVSGTDSSSGYEIIDSQKHFLETIMLSLRTIQGFDLREICVLNNNAINALKDKIAAFVNSDFLKVKNNGRVVFTDHGAVLADEIISEIVSEI